MFALPEELVNVHTLDTINNQYENCFDTLTESSRDIMYYYMFGLFVYVIFAIKFKFCSFLKASVIGAFVCALFYTQYINDYSECVNAVTMTKNDSIDSLLHLYNNVTKNMEHITKSYQYTLSKNEQIYNLVKEKLMDFES
jgi:hypothetical protein